MHRPEATVETGATTSTVNVMCVPDVAPGDHVMVHAGYAVTIVSACEAEERSRLIAAVRTGERPE